MPAFTTAIGAAIGLSGGLATAAGVGVTGAAIYGGSQAIKSLTDKGSGSPEYGSVSPADTGKMSDEEASDVARRKLFRTGTIFTSPTGLNNSGNTTQARLK